MMQLLLYGLIQEKSIIIPWLFALEHVWRSGSGHCLIIHVYFATNLIILTARAHRRGGTNVSQRGLHLLYLLSHCHTQVRLRRWRHFMIDHSSHYLIIEKVT